MGENLSPGSTKPSRGKKGAFLNQNVSFMLEDGGGSKGLSQPLKGSGLRGGGNENRVRGKNSRSRKKSAMGLTGKTPLSTIKLENVWE